jgi:alanyl-tRNA synthetase
MRYFTSWMVAILLFGAPQIAVAQHRGTGGASGSKNSGTPAQDTDSDIKEFQKTFALQATEEQKKQLHSWKENTEAVKNRLQKLRATVVPNDLSSQLNELQAAIEKSSSGYHDFVSSLTKAQQAGLKKSVQNLKKANDKLAKAVTTALHELGQSKSGVNAWLN